MSRTPAVSQVYRRVNYRLVMPTFPIFNLSSYTEIRGDEAGRPPSFVLSGNKIGVSPGSRRLGTVTFSISDQIIGLINQEVQHLLGFPVWSHNIRMKNVTYG